MKKKWSSYKVKDIQRWLALRWPDTFTPGPDLRPLSLSIYADILKYRTEHPGMSGRVLREVLKRHTNSYGYLYGLMKGKHRYDLAGKAVEEVSEAHRALARATLRAMQKVAQKERKDKRLVSRKNDGGSVPAPVIRKETSHVVTGSSSKTPVIRYKQPKRKIVRPQESTVELAS